MFNYLKQRLYGQNMLRRVLNVMKEVFWEVVHNKNETISIAVDGRTMVTIDCIWNKVEQEMPKDSN